METREGYPMFSLTAIQGFGKVWSLAKCTTMEIKKNVQARLVFTSAHSKSACILFYKASPIFWMMFCTCSKTPTTRSKKPVSLECFLPFFCRWLSSKTFQMFVLCKSCPKNKKKEKKKAVGMSRGGHDCWNAQQFSMAGRSFALCHHQITSLGLYLEKNNFSWEEILFTQDQHLEKRYLALLG